MRWTLALLISSLSLPALALRLDCEKQADGTYLCVEITDAGGQSPGGAEAESPIEQRYLEQAKRECEYDEPRRRATGKAPPASLVEERKLAEAAYQRCLREKAAELKKADQ